MFEKLVYRLKVGYTYLVLNLLILTVLFFIFRTALPVFKYPFIILYLTTIFYILFNNSRIFYKKYGFLKSFIIPVILLFILVISFSFSNKLFLTITKDIINGLLIFSFFYLGSITIKSKKDFNIFYHSFINWLVLFASFIVLIKVFNISNLLFKETRIDYNFALIPIFFGMITIFSKLYSKEYKVPNHINILYYFLLILFSYTIVLSGSKRSIFLFVCLIIVFSIKQIVIIKNKDKNLFFLYYLTFLIIITTTSGMIFYKTSFVFKNRVLNELGVENILNAKHGFARKIYRYVEFFNNDNSYTNFFNKLWSHGFDPKYPDSGWGVRTHKTIYPLEGNGYDIIPNEVKGYLLDKTTEVTNWNNNAFSLSHIDVIEVTNSDSLCFSVYCYVSKEFNGEWVQIHVKGDGLETLRKRYPLDQRGEWKKISINEKIDYEGYLNFYLSFAKYGVKDFSTLKGHVIFAYPTYEIISGNDSISSDTLHSFSTIPKSNIIHKKYSTSDKSDYQKASIINGLPKIPLTVLLQKGQDPDPIRNWIKNVINEDTTYYGYTADINFPHDPKDAIHGRTDRWKFAWELYTKEYNWVQKIFGNGFDYLNWYGYFFHNEKTKTDWPHNPFLSVLLYSGIIGLGLYLLLLFKVIVIYVKYIKEYYLLFIFWGITFFFSFFSANSPFNPPVMGFFMMLPFFIDYIHKKEEKEQNKKLEQNT